MFFKLHFVLILLLMHFTASESMRSCGQWHKRRYSRYNGNNLDPMIKYKFEEGYDNYYKGVVKNAMNKIEKQFSPVCIQFVEIPTEEICSDCITFQLSTSRKKCEFQVFLNGIAYVEMNPDCFDIKGANIVKVLANAIGLNDETERIDRNHYITLRNDLIEETKRSCIELIEPDQTPFDFYSVTKNFFPYYCKQDGHRDCLEVNSAYDYFLNEDEYEKKPNKLSFIDIISVSRMYGCTENGNMDKLKEYEKKLYSIGLIDSSKRGEGWRVKELLENGADIDERDEDGYTSIYYANKKEDTFILETLTNHKINMQPKNLTQIEKQPFEIGIDDISGQKIFVDFHNSKVKIGKIHEYLDHVGIEVTFHGNEQFVKGVDFKNNSPKEMFRLNLKTREIRFRSIEGRKPGSVDLQNNAANMKCGYDEIVKWLDCDFQSDNLRKVQYDFHDGYYSGQTLTDAPTREGFGLFTSKDTASSYIGFWENDNKEGFGVDKTADGKTFAGEFNNNFKDIGVEFSTSEPFGKILISQYNFGQASGLSVFFDPVDETFYFGMIRNGRKIGKGVLINTDLNIIDIINNPN